ncbi:uncharacterized protein [Musca autumnalis]|uniref:uncharacterized protein n=1 Tax=Musca autumnalis TaxID=221902 RepID=UPI003CF62596
MRSDGSTATGRAGVADDYLQRRRHSNRLKRSPLASPLPMVGSSSATTPMGGPGSGVIKFEPSTNLDENEEKYNLQQHSTMINTDDDDDEEGMESEQPCDLRLPSHFKLNLVSMALQQAAAAAEAAMITGAATGTTVAGSAGSTGMTSATQLQQAALHTIAAVATSHQTPLHGLHPSPHVAAATHAFMNFPPAGAAGGTSPKRRYSSSSAGGSGTGATAGGGLLNVPSAGVPSASGSSTAVLNTSTGSGGGVGPSTSAIVAPHTPSSSGGGTGNTTTGVSGSGGGGGSGAQLGPGSAGATAGSGMVSGGSGGGTGSGGTAPWGGAYTCDRCGNSYARPHSLNRHVRFECGVEPKFECPICHKKSKHKHNLVLHMRTHQHR